MEHKVNVDFTWEYKTSSIKNLKYKDIKIPNKDMKILAINAVKMYFLYGLSSAKKREKKFLESEPFSKSEVG